MGSNLQAITGTDGYISPEDWNEALRQWLEKGYTAKSFYENYGDFINPADPQDYNLY